jgi:hypothetical protein
MMRLWLRLRRLILRYLLEKFKKIHFDAAPAVAREKMRPLVPPEPAPTPGPAPALAPHY